MPKRTPPARVLVDTDEDYEDRLSCRNPSTLRLSAQAGVLALTRGGGREVPAGRQSFLSASVRITYIKRLEDLLSIRLEASSVYTPDQHLYTKMYRTGLLLLAAALLPLASAYGVPRQPPQQVPSYQQTQQEISPILFPSESGPEQQKLCPASTVYQKVTETEVVPTYVTKTLDRYVTEYETQVQTQYQTVATTVVQPSYITETEYQTNYKTNYETEYLTETVHNTQTIHSTYTQVDTTSVYVTKTQDHYVTNTYTVTATITSSVPHYVTTTSEINNYVTVTKECNAPIKNGGYGYGK
ncbi:uncharacterized protein LOC125034019 [Penaeus chinensis]|uniref:uncharacterized protein LOC125034019 n=1 Tax=Penaeus chinensis TaxID=139456 RepID=UPI001FB779C5|nr:uncharacterized protein LOC125034019 [Penaeus chinensis]